MWSVSLGTQDEGKRVYSPKQLTVTMFSMLVLQLLELQFSNFLIRLVIRFFYFALSWTDNSKPSSSSFSFRSKSNLPFLNMSRCLLTQRPSCGSRLYLCGTLPAMQGERKVQY
jgi:hypothetical protein